MVDNFPMTDIPTEHKKKSPKIIRFYLVIVSTSLSHSESNYTLKKPPATDKTTPLVKELLQAQNYRLIGMSVIPDQTIKIQTEFVHVVEKHGPDILIFSGGTGITKSDNTTEAIYPLLDKHLNGFDVLFHQLSYEQIGPASILSRSTAGVYQESLVFVLPGSPNAVKLALEKIILPEAGHLLAMIRSSK